MRMSPSRTVGPAGDAPAPPAGGGWMRLLALVAFTASMAALIALLVLSPGPRFSIGHGASTLGAAGGVPALTIGAMVTMVGPLGITFPCWAASHFARPPRARPSSPRAPSE